MKTLTKTLSICIAICMLLSCEDKPVPPVLSTASASAITTTSAVSGGNVTDDGGAAIISRGVCWNTSTDPDITNSKTSESGGSGSFTSNITQLNPNTTYFVRAYATNSAGTSYGSSLSFKTLGDKPSSTSGIATDILTTSATLAGTVNPNSLSTTVTFEYGLTTDYGSTSTAVQSPLSGDSNGDVTASLTGLNPGKVYHFRIKAENSLGITYSSDMTFTTLGQAPSCVTLAATDISITTASLNGTVNANYLSSIVTVEYGLTSTYGSIISATQSPVTGSTITNVNANITGLIPGNIYHFRINAENSLGLTKGADMTFTTLGNIPSLTIGAVSDITPTTATLNVVVNPNYLPTSVILEYGIDINYGNTIIVTQNPVTGSLNINLTANLTTLTKLSTYHYRFKAENQLGITLSNDMSFTTIGTVSDIDGNVYKTVLIGNQEWMAENLKTKHYSNGDPILNGEAVLNHCDQNSYYFNYNLDPNKTAIYGLLYNYYAASNFHAIEPVTSNSIPSGIQGACPTGWHLPSVPEFEIMIDFLGGTEVAGGKLKSITLWDSPNQGATNSSTFNALPAGEYDKQNYGYDYMGQRTFMWSSSGNYDDLFGLYLSYTSFQTPFNNARHRCNGATIRCVKD